MRLAAPNAGQRTLVFWENTRRKRGIQYEIGSAESVTIAGGRCSRLRKCWTRQFWSSFRVGSRLKAVGVK